MINNDTFFEPKAVYDHFIAITELSHPSANQEGVDGNEDPVRDYVHEVASNISGVEVFYDAEATAPGERVIVVRRPGSGNYTGKAPVILQAHMDKEEI